LLKCSNHLQYKWMGHFSAEYKNFLLVAFKIMKIIANKSELGLL